MDLEYRLKNDKNFAILYSLFGEPSQLGEFKCLNCGREIDPDADMDDVVLIEYDLEHPYPDQWVFCCAECLREHLSKRFSL